jgi:hypothetical protein
MHHDDLVLNIATTAPADRLSAAPLTSAQGKRNKYSFSAKKERASNARKGQFEYNLLPEKNNDRTERGKAGDQSRGKAGEERYIKRERNTSQDQ